MAAISSGSDGLLTTASHHGAPLYRRESSSERSRYYFFFFTKAPMTQVTTENHTISAKQFDQFAFLRQN
jgi:hypothetical protein